MFKPHYGNCSCCGEPGLIVVKKGLRDVCNYRKKREKNGVLSEGGNPSQDIEGYTNTFRFPVRKKKPASKSRRSSKATIREKTHYGKASGLQGITKEHTRVYMQALDYTIADFIPCELSGDRCNDVHYIYARGMGGSDLEDELYNRIENLMGLTRELHTKYGDKEQYYDMLIEKHFEFLSANGVPYDKHFFEKWPK